MEQVASPGAKPLQPDQAELARRLTELRERAVSQEAPVLTDFLDPAQLDLAQWVAGQDERADRVAAGGYPQAERRRVAFVPRFYLTELVDLQLAAVEARGDFRFQAPTHRDCLGSLLGSTGLRREKIGDLVLAEWGCQAVVEREVLPIVLAQWREIRRVPVAVKEIDLEQLAVPPQRVKEIRATVASLRLDAVAAAGFGESRTAMVREIKAGHLKLNWRIVTDPAETVQVGDVLSLRGRGRVEIAEATGSTRKGRQGLLLKRLF
ncbi:MAG: photosystem II S4 domain protein [Firmicutes bacterium]|nr:photosystem II S4 domain protein [Bacillota bacterium]